jgi:DNA-binding CsgD family transcriptional regulator/Fe-S-cluster formation regulator IscX/YfhJ
MFGRYDFPRMTRLPAVRLRSLVEAGAQLAAFDDLPSLRSEVLDVLDGVVRCDTSSYNEIRHGAPPTVVSSPPEHLHGNASLIEPFAALAWQNPLIAHHAATGDPQAVRFSDLLSRRQLCRLELYQVVYRDLGVEHQIATTLTPPGTRVIGIALNRTNADFTDEDADALNLLRPQIYATYVRLTELTQLRRILTALDEDPHGQAVALVDNDGNVVRATAAAERLLQTVGPAPLPASVRAWIRSGARDPSQTKGILQFHHQGRLLHVELSQHDSDELRAIVLQAPGDSDLCTAGRALGLSPRESQVLQRLGSGAQTAEIARQLQVSPRTVEKHLEHIYRKLEVNNRTQAIQRGLSEAHTRSAG